MPYRLTAAAERQLETILAESTERHGRGAADRYEELLLTALQVVGADPMTPGSKATRRRGGVRIYPIRLSRERPAPKRRVKRPRHIIVYAPLDGDAVVLGFVHDSMALGHAVGRLVRNMDRD